MFNMTINSMARDKSKIFTNDAQYACRVFQYFLDRDTAAVGRRMAYSSRPHKMSYQGTPLDRRTKLDFSTLLQGYIVRVILGAENGGGRHWNRLVERAF